MVRHLVIDLNNLVSRASFAVKGIDDPDLWAGQAMTIVFQSLLGYFQKFQADHLVVVMDSYSWRKAILSDYKVSRTEKSKPQRAAAKKTTHRVLDQLAEFLHENTNVTVLRAYGVEADDFIARWTQAHTGLHNVIVSNDRDFFQLVADHVDLFDPFHKKLYTVAGILYQDHKAEWVETLERFGERWIVLQDSLGERERFDPQWELFFKCMRGDVSDCIRPAYPRVSLRRLREAYADHGGVKWNNLINSTWGIPGETPNQVRDLYELNRSLIDLRRQPDEIKVEMDRVIAVETTRDPKHLVESYFDEFYKAHRMVRLTDKRASLIPMLASPYVKGA